MALTVDLTRPVTTFGDAKVAIAQVDFDNSYPTNGESFTPSLVGMSGFDMVIFGETTSGYTFSYDYTNEKIKVFYGDYTEASDGALVEVANTTDLSSLTNVRVLCIGK